MTKLRGVSKGARDRIVEAATNEFVCFGFAGARLARIAKRAKVSSQLLYHYFHSKKGLYSAILEFHHSEGPFPCELPESPDYLVPWFEKLQDRPNAVIARLALWESLENKNGHYVAEGPRREFVNAAIGSFRKLQEKGYLSNEFDPILLFMTFCAMDQVPGIYKQILDLIGIDHQCPEFRSRWIDHFMLVARALKGPVSPTTGEAPCLSMPLELTSNRKESHFPWKKFAISSTG